MLFSHKRPAVIFYSCWCHCVCVCDSMEGGELFSRIQAKGDQAFTEKGETWTDPERIVGSRKLRQTLFLCVLLFSGIAAGLRHCFPLSPPRGLWDHAGHRHSHRLPPPHRHRPQRHQGAERTRSLRPWSWRAAHLLTCLLFCVSSPAREPPVYIERKKHCPQINRLWFCKGDHAPQPPADPLLHTVLCG